MIAIFRKRLKDPAPELRALVEEARAYVKEKYVPKVQYCIDMPKPVTVMAEKPGVRCSIAETDVSAQKKPAPGQSADELLKAAREDTAVYDSLAMASAYHEWEKRNSVRKSFSGEVLRRLDESGTPYVDFYKRAWLDKKMFYKIKSDYGYRPSKDTAVKCCFALRLDSRETDELLQLAEHAFSPGNSRDLALRFCIEHGITDLREVSYLLSGLGERPLD